MVKLKSVAKYPICHKGTIFMPNVETETSRETASFLLKSYRKEKFFILVEGSLSKPVGNFPVVNINPIISKNNTEVKGFIHDFKTFEEKKEIVIETKPTIIEVVEEVKEQAIEEIHTPKKRRHKKQ